MSGSESFGSGERYYSVLCPVTYKFVDQDQDTILCPRSGLISYRYVVKIITICSEPIRYSINKIIQCNS